jgi:hypothetical protein
VKDENGGLLADSDNIFNRWKTYFSQLLNVRIRQIEIHTAEPLVHGPILLRLKLLLQSGKKCKFPGSDQIPAELIEGGTLLRFTNINSIWFKEELPDQWKEPIVLPIYKKGYKTDCAIIMQCPYQLHTKFYPIPFSQG